MKSTRTLLLTVSLALFTPAPPLTGQIPTGEALPVVEKVFPNGLRILVLRRPTAPTVAFVTYYRVGAVHDAPGQSGIAHLVEHMLFKGTTTIGTNDHAAELRFFPRMDAVQDSISELRALGGSGDTTGIDGRIGRLAERLKALEDSARAFVVPNEFDRILSRNGARGLNATTTHESTTYYVELPSNRARLWFVLEADRLRNPVFRDFYSERDVVAEERRMRVETDPAGLLWERFLGTAFQRHPYGRPVVGKMEDIQALSRRHAEEYFRRFYGPNNAVVAVVGDVDPDEILAWAEAYLAPIPSGDDPPPIHPREPEQTAERRVEVVYDAEPHLLIGWRIPAPDHPDFAALTILAHILSGGNTSRVFNRLVLVEKLAVSTSAGLQPGERDPQLFTISAAPRAPHTTAELEAAIYEEIARVQAEPPEIAELERIRNQLEAGEVRRLRSNLGLAFQLAASASTYGDWRTTFQQASRLMEVQPEDVQRVARVYLRPENRTVATLVRPEGQR